MVDLEIWRTEKHGGFSYFTATVLRSLVKVSVMHTSPKLAQQNTCRIQTNAAGQHRSSRSKVKQQTQSEEIFIAITGISE